MNKHESTTYTYSKGDLDELDNMSKELLLSQLKLIRVAFIPRGFVVYYPENNIEYSEDQYYDTMLYKAISNAINIIEKTDME